MSEEVLAEVPAPEQEATAAPEPVEAQPGEVKTFSQEELDAAIFKRLAREQRKWERERVAAAPVVAADPRPEQFDSTESYADALAMKKAEQLLYERDVQRQQTEVLGAYHDREEEARNKYDDFEQVAYNPSLKITTVMAQTIQSSDIGPDVAYYLGANPKEADRISRLAPYVQAKEIGRIEAKLASEPMVKKTSSAPPPFTPVTASSKGASTYDTTDPRSIKSMSTSEWIAADRARQVKKMEARLR
jgi:hypothetical protein